MQIIKEISGTPRDSGEKKDSYKLSGDIRKAIVDEYQTQAKRGNKAKNHEQIAEQLGALIGASVSGAVRAAIDISVNEDPTSVCNGFLAAIKKNIKLTRPFKR